MKKPKYKTPLAFIPLIALLPGCGLVQSKRIFQDEVRAPVINTITEDVKAAAKYLDRELTPANAPAATDAVADALSDRVGPPAAALAAPPQITTDLREAHNDLTHRRDDLNQWLHKRQGTELEGTGFSILGAGGFLLILALIPILLLVPALIPLVIQLVQTIAGTSRNVLKATLKSTTTAIDDWKKDHPDQAQKLLDKLSIKMDAREKTLIKRIKEGQL